MSEAITTQTQLDNLRTQIEVDTKHYLSQGNVITVLPQGLETMLSDVALVKKSKGIYWGYKETLNDKS